MAPDETPGIAKGKKAFSSYDFQCFILKMAVKKDEIVGEELSYEKIPRKTNNQNHATRGTITGFSSGIRT